MIVILFMFAILTRTVLHIAPNVEFISSLIIFGTLKYGKSGIIFGILALLLSDIFLGHGFGIWNIITILSFGIAGLVQFLYKKKTFIGIFEKHIFAVLIFFLVSNSLCFVFDTFNMYPNTIAGYFNCLWMGVPFARNQMVGSLLYCSIVYCAYYLVEKQYEYSIN